LICFDELTHFTAHQFFYMVSRNARLAVCGPIFVRRPIPMHLAWLLSLPLLERERMLGGNWKIRPAAGLYFKREWCAITDPTLQASRVRLSGAPDARRHIASTESERKIRI
jgi:hypothetical protein